MEGIENCVGIISNRSGSQPQRMPNVYIFSSIFQLSNRLL